MSLKSFKEFTNEADTLPKRGLLREPSHPTTSTSGEYSHAMADKNNVVGFLGTKHNNAEGYAIYTLSSDEAKEFGKDAFRIVWSKGTTIVKFNFRDGKVIFIDNEAYADGELKWQSPMGYDRIVVDNTPKALKALSK